MPLTYVSILTTHGQIGYKLYDPNIYGDAMVKNARERLESIKAAHKSSHGASSIRMEDYLEVIAELVDLKGYATTLDISRYMDVSAPSVTKMLHRLDDEKYLKYERYHGINLTKKGVNLARKVRQKHSILLEFFEILGVENVVANQDAEGIEHHLNPKTIKRLRKFLAFVRSDPRLLKRFNDL